MVNHLVFIQDMNREIKMQDLDGSLYEGDDSGVRISVKVYRDGTPEALSGSIIAEIMKSDGTLIVQNGGITGGNIAYVIMPKQALLPGPIKIVIKNSAGGVKTTICAIRGTVTIVNGTAYLDPGSVIPSLADYTSLVTRAEAAAATVNGLSFSATQLTGDDYRCVVVKT